MSFKELPEFQKEIKRYSKRYKSLFNDLEQFCDVVSLTHLVTVDISISLLKMIFFLSLKLGYFVVI